MNNGQDDGVQSQHTETNGGSDNGASIRALLSRPRETSGADQSQHTSNSSLPALGQPLHDRLQILQRLAETTRRLSSPSISANEDNFLERSQATMLAIENRARALERSTHGFQAEMHNALDRARIHERATESLARRTDSSSSTGTTVGPTTNAHSTNAPGTAVSAPSVPGVLLSEPRSDARTPQTRGGEWSRRNESLANQEYELSRSDFLERRDRILANSTGNRLRDGSLGAHGSSNSATSNPTATTGAVNLSGAAEQSASARRDLERALRDYRIARRALRNHYNNDTVSPADQNNPSYQSVMAQIAEQRDRNRIRARGHSRLNTLERSDMIVNDIAAAAGVRHDVWRSDNEDDSLTGPASRLTGLHRGPQADARSPLYLGPTTAGSNDTTSPGGMREHYQRLQDRRGPTRTTNSLGVDTTTDTVFESATGSGARFRRRLEGDRSQRLNETIDRFSDTLLRLQDKGLTSTTTSYKSKAKNMLKYLTLLNGLDNDSDKSTDWAKQLGCDSLAESLVKQTDVDLPLRIDELPSPHVSSWVDNGMSWTGVQKGGSTRSDDRHNSPADGFASGPLFESESSIEERMLHFRAWRHRERIRAERLERERSRRNSSLWWRSQGADGGLLRGLSNGSETLADVERHLSDLLQDEERRLGHNGGDGWRAPDDNVQPQSSAGTATLDKEQHENKWPVKVTLHEVNWQNMTVFGTMIASHIPDRSASSAAVRDGVTTGSGAQYVDDAKSEDTHSMETFFDGEIIDFRTHELETVTGKPGYRVGGLETDIRYWSRIGPFREAIDKGIQRCKENKSKNLTDWSEDITETSEENQAKIKEFRESINASVNIDGLLDETDLENVVDETMAGCLGSRKWLEKAVGENGWVLMRWKERCFVTTSTSSTNSNESTSADGPTLTSQSRRRPHPFYVPSSSSSPFANSSTATTMTYTTTYANTNPNTNSNPHPGDRTPSWGLTIRGFYYVAVHRQTGRIEALYYDSGSQPFQELKMRPLRAGSDRNVDMSKTGVEDKSPGVRAEFGAFEFR